MTMTKEEPHAETEILDAVAAAAEALHPHEQTDEALEPLPLGHGHLPVHNSVHDHEQQHQEEVDEAVCKVEEHLSHEQQQQQQQHEEHAEQHAQHPQDVQDVLAMTFEELNASLHEPPLDFDPNDSASMINAIKQLQHTQRQQSQLILSMRDMIDDLQLMTQPPQAAHEHHYTAASSMNTSASKFTKHSSWQSRPSSASRSSPSPRTKAEIIRAQLQSLPDPIPNLNTTDEEIDTIIHNKRSQTQGWPVHRLKKWIEEEDLQKVRLHRSVKHTHYPIRIPRTDKNKEGRLICKLCSGGKCNRNTRWMCSTCEVPLCVDTVDGDATFTHHLLWHRCLDLREESERCNALLRERRFEKKRGSIGGDGGGEEGHEIKRGRMMDGVLHQEDIMMQHHEHHGQVQHHHPHHHEEHASEMTQHSHHESGHVEHSVQYHDDGLNVEPVDVNQV